MPIHGVEVQVWDEKENPLPAGEIGELVVRGKNVMKGYYKNPLATAETITPEGWLKTGDLASIDEEGFITIAGRKKELIICAGENIYPLEIEDVLCSHPAVAEAAVIGIPHDTKGEVPKAYVSPIPEAVVNISELRALCREKLAAFKVPAEFEVRDELPKGASGKVLKRVLIAERGS
jgi:long-chain acyl-CoA synthetase